MFLYITVSIIILMFYTFFQLNTPFYVRFLVEPVQYSGKEPGTELESELVSFNMVKSEPVFGIFK